LFNSRAAAGLVQAEVEETLKRIQGHKGVLGIVIVNKDGLLSALALWVGGCEAPRYHRDAPPALSLCG
jgi:hypothetical protein